MTGSWIPEAVLAAACAYAAARLLRVATAEARALAAAAAILGLAAVLGGLLFAGVAPGIAAPHRVVTRLFETAGFALVVVVALGLAWPRVRTRAAAPLLTVALAAVGIVAPLAPLAVVAHALAGWGAGSRTARVANVAAAVALAAVIAIQLALPASPTRVDLFHLTLAAWAVCLSRAVPARLA